MKKYIIISVIILLLVLSFIILMYKNQELTTIHAMENELETSMTATALDEIAPKIEVTYSKTEKTNKDVIVTITSNEEIQGIITTANGGKQEIPKKFSFIVHEEDYRKDSEYIEKNMPYIWCSSPNVEEQESVPLIVFLHGSGEFSTTQEVLRNSIYIKTFENWNINGFNGYVMFPHGITDCFDMAGESAWANSGLQMRMMNIIDNFIQEKGNIDTNKIILVGHSTGGVGALCVANTFPNDFDKLVAISAVCSCDVSNITMPTLCICGENDSEAQLKSLPLFKEKFGEENVYTINGADHSAVVEKAFLEDTGEHVGKAGNGHSDLIEWMIDYKTDNGIEGSGWKLSEDKKILTKTYTANGSETISVYDEVGNESNEVQVSVNNIDKIVPEIEVSYSKTEKTKNDVIVTITANEEIKEVTGWELSEDKKILNKTYTANGSETISVYDEVGNKSNEVQVSVNNIDKICPIVKVKSSKDEITNENILVTITANEEIQEVNGWELSEDKLNLTQIYDKNVQEKIEIKDLVGNITEVEINLFNIDKTNPEVKIDYSQVDITNGDVVVIITLEEEIQEVKGWQLSKDKKMLTKTYKNNEKEIIEIRDLAGNITKVEINITNIDKEKPVVKVEYSLIDGKYVIAKIISNEELQELTGWELLEDKKVLTKIYQKNINEVIEVNDIAGNVIQVEIKIEDIDDKQLTENEKDDENEKLPESEKENKDETENNTEKDKSPVNKTDNSTSIETIPHAGKSKVFIIVSIFFSILFIVTTYKLNKYKDI